MADPSRQELAEVGRSIDENELQGDDRLFRALVSGCHVENAATVAGVSERTAYRRLADPELRRQLDEARQSLRESILARLSDAAHDAIGVLNDLMVSSDDDRVRMQVAKTLLDSLMQKHRQESSKQAAGDAGKPATGNVIIYLPENGREPPAIKDET
ncbi:hypothetical protein [Crateriforma conspicua]|uniref:Homeodomain phBC6A51-type domain-containing protein n=1 Tax=Crateriforma conspicua TaxID=2527996 RepID=A0A5C5Y2K4_9PLAN|nr:hypothetical protein [Crateriforma conspicua]TWT69444.1 hypothetical protein Pan14r_17300 [Crateriforma conspicua]